MTARTLAERVAALLDTEATRRHAHRCMTCAQRKAVAKFVLAADRKRSCANEPWANAGCDFACGDCTCGGYSSRERYSAALSELAKALGVEE